MNRSSPPWQCPYRLVPLLTLPVCTHVVWRLECACLQDTSSGLFMPFEASSLPGWAYESAGMAAQRAYIDAVVIACCDHKVTQPYSMHSLRLFWEALVTLSAFEYGLK